MLLLISDLKEDKLQHSKIEEEGRMFHQLHVHRMNHDFWGGVRGLGSKSRKGCELVRLLVFLRYVAVYQPHNDLLH